MILPEFNGIGAITQSNSYAGHQILCLHMSKRYCLRRVFRESWCRNRNMHVSLVAGQAWELNWSPFTRRQKYHHFPGRVSTNISLSCQVCSFYRCLNRKILILRKTKQKHHPTLIPQLNWYLLSTGGASVRDWFRGWWQNFQSSTMEGTSSCIKSGRSFVNAQNANNSGRSTKSLLIH